MKPLSNSHKQLKGTLEVPGDKSISHRTIMLGALAHGETKVYNFLHSEDSMSTIHAFQRLGVDIDKNNNTVTIYGKGVQGLSQPKDSVNMGNSGTTVRLISGILAALPFNTKLVGDHSLSHRPMDRIIEPLTEMGASIESSGGTLPMLIRGRPLTPIHYRLPVDSAQVKSAIMLAGLLTEGITSVLEQNTTRDHTERMLPIFGVEVNRTDQGIQLEGGQNLTSGIIHVPGDVSSASFWIAGATITPGSQLTIKNVGLNPTRLGFINVLKRMGAQINAEVKRYEGDEPIGNISASYTERLTPTPLQKHEIATLVDEVPLLALVATQANGQMKMKHLEELRYKESDRIKTTVNTLKQFGATIIETEDGMIIEGKQELHGAQVDSYGDHRIAMMASIASFITTSKVTIKDTECIRISYPRFFEDLASITI